MTPSPTPDTSNFESIKVTVKTFDGKKLVYTLDNKTEKTISDVSDIKVWLPQRFKEKKPQRLIGKLSKLAQP